MGYKLLAFSLFASFSLAHELSAQINADVIQTISSDEKTLQYEAYVHAAGDNWVFEYLEPEHKKLCAQGNEVLLIDDDLEQVSFYKSRYSLPELISKAKRISEGKFRAQIDNTSYLIKAKNSQITEIEFQDEFENQVKMQFFPSAKTPPDCQIPSNYDLVENGQI